MSKWEREQKDNEHKWARGMGLSEEKNPSKVAKIAYNRIYIPEEEPPKWYPQNSLTQVREDAVKEAANIIRKGEATHAKVYKVGTEDGVMWGVKTYPKIIPWYVKEGLIPEDEDKDRKKKSTKPKSKRVKKSVLETFLPTTTKIKSMKDKAEAKIKSVYSPVTLNLRKKKPKKVVVKRKSKSDKK
jgi:hypothetical protein